jgi:tetratricopeptide (TPR) repeat protein
MMRGGSMVITKQRFLLGAMLGLSFVLIAACGGPEQKKAKFLKRGTALYEKADFVKAKLEFKNALQIDPQFAEAYYMLGMSAVQLRDFNGAYGMFVRTIELSPQHAGAQIQLAKFLVGSGKLDEAMGKTESVLKSDPKNEDALILKTVILAKKSSRDAAQKFLESVIGMSVRKPEGYTLLASLSVQKGDIQGAERILQEGIRANEKAVPLYLALTDLYLKNKKADDAVTLVQKMIDREPGVSQHRMLLAGIYWETGKEQAAADVLKKYISEDPKQEARWIESANFYTMRNRAADAEKMLKDGISRTEKSFELRFSLSALYLSTNRADEAVALLQECIGLERDPSNPNVLHAKNSLAQLYISRQETDKAQKYAEEVLKESPKNVDANYIAGTIYLRKNDSARAVAVFNTVVTEQPQFVPAYIGLADAYAAGRDFNLAGDTLQKAQKIAPDSRDVLRAMGRIAADQKEFKKAETYYRGLLEKNPKDIEVRSDLGDLFLRAGDAGRAEREYAEIKRSMPDQPLGYIKMSGLYASQKKWDRAIAELDLVVRRHPDLWSAANDLAYLLTEYGSGKKDVDRAMQLVQKANTLSHENPSVLDTFGWVCFRNGDLKQAITWLEKAQAGNSVNPVINYHLGVVYDRSGDKNKAKEFLRKAIAFKSGFPGKEDAEKILASIH